MNNITYQLQYVNLVDGRTFHYYKQFSSMEDLEIFVDAEFARWSSFEVIVVQS